MCGILGYYLTNPNNNQKIDHSFFSNILQTLSKRGPDAQNCFFDDKIALGHTRLSIIDTSTAANQPMKDQSERYILCFNGEIFNFKELKTKYFENFNFETNSDTEVLLQLLINFGTEKINELNGFWAFSFYDNITKELLICRDRYGEKPLYYFQDDQNFFFGSELKSILPFVKNKNIDFNSLYEYFQFQYLPPNSEILHNIKQLEKGSWLIIKGQEIKTNQYYQLAIIPNCKDEYHDAKIKFINLLEDSVKLRLVSDVPIGSFLSGGVDSSVVSALAAKNTNHLHTFSIGFKDEPFFDETKYANIVAKHIKSDHTVFSLSNDDLLEHLQDMLDYLDTPFADSSALAMFILAKKTKQKVTVALSGDGADELLGGYQKHGAEWKLQNMGLKESIISSLQPIWSVLPKSRNNFITNKFRQFHRFSVAANLNSDLRYWHLATILSESKTMQLFNYSSSQSIDLIKYKKDKELILNILNKQNVNINDSLLVDQNMVLTGDMLVKVDRMSMANSLEVRSPFLDYRLVDYINSLPSHFKVNKSERKKILIDSCKNLLPQEIFSRSKKGFEVPLLKWFRNELKSKIESNWLNDEKIIEQNIFDLKTVQNLKKQLFSNNPEDVHATIWAMIVFQNWYQKYYQA